MNSFEKAAEWSGIEKVMRGKPFLTLKLIDAEDAASPSLL